MIKKRDLIFSIILSLFKVKLNFIFEKKNIWLKLLLNIILISFLIKVQFWLSFIISIIPSSNKKPYFILILLIISVIFITNYIHSINKNIKLIFGKFVEGCGWYIDLNKFGKRIEIIKLFANICFQLYLKEIKKIQKMNVY